MLTAVPPMSLKSVFAVPFVFFVAVPLQKNPPGFSALPRTTVSGPR
jgi:hypothetical protein